MTNKEVIDVLEKEANKISEPNKLLQALIKAITAVEILGELQGEK